jgi:mono/diheme cytochrome c family protein
MISYDETGSCRRGIAGRVAVGLGLAAALIGGSGRGSYAATDAPSSGAPSSATQDEGARIYARACASCHMARGQGVDGTFPPLAGSEWVTGDPGHLVRIVLHGVTGPLMVDGEEYGGTMPPQGAALSDADIAALSSYVRTAWGNDASPVSAAEVAAIRAASRGRNTPWTAAELLAVAEK